MEKEKIENDKSVGLLKVQPFEIEPDGGLIEKEFKEKEINDIKFPTFDIPGLEEQLKAEITYESLIFDLKSCDEGLSFFCDKYDNLILQHKNSKFIKAKLKEHNMNHISYKIFALIIKRQIFLLYCLLGKKFNKGENGIDKLFSETFLNVDEDILAKDFLDKNCDYFTVDCSTPDDCESEARLQVIQLIQNLIKNERSLIDFETKINSNFLPSISTLGVSFKFIKTMIDQVSIQIQELTSMTDDKLLTEEILILFFNNCNKLEILSNFFILSYKIPHDDMFNIPENSETWHKIKKHFERRVVFSRYVIKKKLQHVFNMVILGNASLSKGFDAFKSNYLQIIGSGWYFAYFFFNKKQASIQSLKFSINPNFEVANKIWNMLDAGGVREILKLTMPSVKFSHKWYLKRTEPEINLEIIKSLIYKIETDSLDLKKEENFDEVDSDFTNFKSKVKPDKYLAEKFYKQRIKSQNNLLIDKPFSQTDLNELISRQLEENRISEYVKVRIINYKEFNIPTNKSMWSYFSCCQVEKNHYNSIIIHIHGGGFIAMSASSHENYTRKWTNQLEIPVFSIDYRLAPENPYPKALDDVYQAYMWIINYAEDVLKIKLENIFLVGDSAGGNLVLSLTYLLIILEKRLPTALILAYPAMRISLTSMSCSMLNVLNDIILPYHLLKYCLESYRREYLVEDDPFVSPLLMNPKVMAHLPPVRIICGSSDPLRDDALVFLNKLMYKMIIF